VKQAKSETFFSENEKERIRMAVKAAEAVTSGEIATMIVDESDRYREAELTGSLFLAVSGALVIAVATAHVTVWSFLPLAAVLFLPFRLLFGLFPQLKLTFAHTARISEAVRLRAVRGFYEQGCIGHAMKPVS
jgi:putative membrane protein